jgi:hypothetical protein
MIKKELLWQMKKKAEEAVKAVVAVKAVAEGKRRRSL